ncbi:hypothetical protein HNQ51_001805 [Inhella inkyongensis]|uniref:Uncharacterized protein n=1 Tax=Inhella inkyongensis TaxID=392593 RepID=A0A840S7E8_9BURK|nr:hypothetical protein [Inhella inkyongensis]MBB5204491.1 hypothetical protein [Inhella inkyongensis]
MNKVSLSQAPSRLLSLLCLLIGIVAWAGADELAQQTAVLSASAKQLVTRINRANPSELEARTLRTQELASERSRVFSKLETQDTEQMVRAQLIYSLREHCNTIPITCQVRLADLSQTLNTKDPKDNQSADMKSLDIGRARAIISGTFKPDELQRLYHAFINDQRFQWKINAIVVRNNTFEFDIERLVSFRAK